MTGNFLFLMACSMQNLVSFLALPLLIERFDGKGLVFLLIQFCSAAVLLIDWLVTLGTHPPVQRAAACMTR